MVKYIDIADDIRSKIFDKKYTYGQKLPYEYVLCVAYHCNKETMKKEELGELIMASEDAMYHVAKTLLYSDADCADAIQEAIVKAFSKLDTLKKDAYAKTWLMRILLNECYSVMRKEKRVVSLEDYRQEEKAEERKDYSELYEAIYRLPEEMRREKSAGPGQTAAQKRTGRAGSAVKGM